MNAKVGSPDNELDVDQELAQFEAEERARLGLEEKTEHWTDAMVNPNFTASQRPHTTILVGGLTIAHDFLVEGTLKGLGRLGRPNVEFSPSGVKPRCSRRVTGAYGERAAATGCDGAAGSGGRLQVRCKPPFWS